MTFNLFGAPHQDWFQSATSAALANGAAVSLLAQAGSGYKWVITDISTVSPQNTVDAIIQILGTGDLVLWSSNASRTGATDKAFQTPIMSADNSHIYVRQTDPSAAARVSISGFKLKNPAT